MICTSRLSSGGRCCWLARFTVAIACVVGLSGSAGAEQTQSETQAVDTLIEQGTKGSFTPAIIERLVRLGAVQAIPVLQQQFAAVADTFTKQALASGLVRLHRTDA